MGDAMVTARMSQAKKDAGNRVLEQIGTTTSKFINSAYDYLIQNETSPFATKTETSLSAKDISSALSRVEDMCLPSSNRYAPMSDDEIRSERLTRHGFTSR